MLRIKETSTDRSAQRVDQTESKARVANKDSSVVDDQQPHDGDRRAGLYALPRNQIINRHRHRHRHNEHSKG